MKKINYSKNIFRAAFILCLCVLASGQVFGQSDCYNGNRGGSKTGDFNFGTGIGGAGKSERRGFVNNTECNAVVGSLRSAGLLIYGIELKPDDKSADETIAAWMKEIDGKPNWQNRFKAGFTAADGIKFLKERFATIGDAWLELFVGTITDQVYGRIPTKTEKDFYVPRLKEQKETYASIFLAEKNKLGKNSSERKATIDRAYQTAMGRAASENDTKYWQTRTEIYKEIIATSREFLYSPNGAKDLKETVTRAYQAKYKNSAVVESRIAKLTADFSKSKMIYVEMVKK